MKFSRLFRLGRQGYNTYRRYQGKGRGGRSPGNGGQQFGGARRRRDGRGGTLERLIRGFFR